MSIVARQRSGRTLGMEEVDATAEAAPQGVGHHGGVAPRDSNVAKRGRGKRGRSSSRQRQDDDGGATVGGLSEQEAAALDNEVQEEERINTDCAFTPSSQGGSGFGGGSPYSSFEAMDEVHQGNDGGGGGFFNGIPSTPPELENCDAADGQEVRAAGRTAVSEKERNTPTRQRRRATLLGEPCKDTAQSSTVGRVTIVQRSRRSAAETLRTTVNANEKAMVGSCSRSMIDTPALQAVPGFNDPAASVAAPSRASVVRDASRHSTTPPTNGFLRGQEGHGRQTTSPSGVITAEFGSTASMGEPMNEIGFYGLPQEAELLYAQRRIVKPYDWQEYVLGHPEVARGRNFVYSLPTSGGKTFIAEVLLMRMVTRRNAVGIFVLPFVSVAEEKMNGFLPFAEAMNFKVEGYYGMSGRYPTPAGPAVFVCTIEKANSLINNMIEEGKREEIGAVVVDELHMLGEQRRGGILELFLSKVLAFSPRAQVIGMSATIPNLPEIASWLKAACYEGTFRPVPLKQHIVVQGSVRDERGEELRVVGTGKYQNEAQQLYDLVYETAPKSSVLVFCATRQQCLDVAGLLITTMKSRHTAEELTQILPPRDKAESIASELRMVSNSPQSFKVAEMLPYGVCYHHGGLMMEERELIERAYRNRLISVLCCTSTLAAGVNLPARRVIFRTPYVGREFLTKSRYLQMCGRAGRAGMDDMGESFLVLTPKELKQGMDLVQSRLEPVTAQLLSEECAMERCVLECVGSGAVVDEAGLQRWGEQTFLHHQAAAKDGGNGGDSPAAASASSTGRDDGVEDETPLFPRYSGPRHASKYRSKSPRREASRDGSTLSASTPNHPDVHGEIAKALDSVVAAGFIARVEATQQQSAAVPSPPSPGGTAARSGSHQRVFHQSRGILSPVGQLSGNGASPPVQPSATSESPILLKPTPFGYSSFRSCFPVEDALAVKAELIALQTSGLILADDLHVCYVLTPMRSIHDAMVPWSAYLRLLSGLNTVRQTIADRVGINEHLIQQQSMGFHFRPQNDEERRQLFRTKKFFFAMMLSDLLAETPMSEVEARYGSNRGQVQSLMRDASIFSSSMTNFCGAMEWYGLEAVLSAFVKRLGYGVKPDLLPLMEIKGIQPSRARALWHAGFKDVKSIATCDPAVLYAKLRTLVDKYPHLKFFKQRSATAIVREANVVFHAKISERKYELVEMNSPALSLAPR